MKTKELNRLKMRLKDAGEISFYGDENRIAVGFFIYGEGAELRAKEVVSLLKKLRDEGDDDA